MFLYLQGLGHDDITQLHGTRIRDFHLKRFNGDAIPIGIIDNNRQIHSGIIGIQVFEFNFVHPLKDRFFKQ
jgi:hypothetical protein